MDITEERQSLIDQRPGIGTPRQAILKLKGFSGGDHRGLALISDSWVHWLDDNADYWTSLPISTVIQLQWIPAKKVDNG